MSEFQKKLKQAFYANFSRRRTDVDGVISYRTYFGTSLPTVRYVETLVDEKKSAADGMDTVAIVDQIRVHHFNEIMGYIDNELRKVLKLQET